MRVVTLVAAMCVTVAAHAQTMPSSIGVDWNKPHEPFRIFGNTYYVGTASLSAVLITSDQGHVLLDGAVPDSPPLIAANIKALGFRIEDVKLIVNSHVHFDHAGGLAGLQRMSGAVVKASPSSAPVLRTGKISADDPQADGAAPMKPVANVQVINDGEVAKVGPIAITAQFTPGHTPGGTTWTWQSCEGERCLNIVYADSLNPISGPAFKYTAGQGQAAATFRASIAKVEKLPCDIIVAVHPEFAGLWDSLKRRDAGNKEALIDATACRRYAATAKAALDKRLASEK